MRLTTSSENMISFSSILPYLEKASSLYESAFPIAERRPTNKWMKFLHEREEFHIEAILKANKTFVGFISYWDFQHPQFVYVEHFAIDQGARCGGIGTETITLFVKRASEKGKPVVLEVEPQEQSEMAHRRIGFYQRCGFALSSLPYLQPPYRTSEEALPLSLMATNAAFLENNHEDICRELHMKVYGTDGVLQA